jgi:hypothetical protein
MTGNTRSILAAGLVAAGLVLGTTEGRAAGITIRGGFPARPAFAVPPRLVPPPRLAFRAGVRGARWGRYTGYNRYGQYGGGGASPGYFPTGYYDPSLYPPQVSADASLAPGDEAPWPRPYWGPPRFGEPGYVAHPVIYEIVPKGRVGKGSTAGGRPSNWPKVIRGAL